jgi:hypothetical protein
MMEILGRAVVMLMAALLGLRPPIRSRLGFRHDFIELLDQQGSDYHPSYGWLSATLAAWAFVLVTFRSMLHPWAASGSVRGIGLLLAHVAGGLLAAVFVDSAYLATTRTNRNIPLRVVHCVILLVVGLTAGHLLPFVLAGREVFFGPVEVMERNAIGSWWRRSFTWIPQHDAYVEAWKDGGWMAVEAILVAAASGVARLSQLAKSKRIARAVALAMALASAGVVLAVTAPFWGRFLAWGTDGSGWRLAWIILQGLTLSALFSVLMLIILGVIPRQLTEDPNRLIPDSMSREPSHAEPQA